MRDGRLEPRVRKVARGAQLGILRLGERRGQRVTARVAFASESLEDRTARDLWESEQARRLVEGLADRVIER
jgi:hypothetical protein